MTGMAAGSQLDLPPGWLLDEVASAGRENLNADHVSRYDSKMDAEAAEELVLLKQLGLNEQSEVLDIGAGTGTGQFTLTAASAGARVVAVDVSPVMLNGCRPRLVPPGRRTSRLCKLASSLTSTAGGMPTSCIPATRAADSRAPVAPPLHHPCRGMGSDDVGMSVGCPKIGT